MRFIFLLVAILACGVTSCEQPPEYLSATQINATVQAAVATAQAAMRTPSLTGTATWTASPSATSTRTLSPTPTATWTLTLTPTPLPTLTRTLTLTSTPILTRTLTLTPTPTPTITPLPPKVNTAILGCDIGLDIIHGMGAVTNAYVRVRNLGGTELTSVCLTLSANAEDKSHPDKIRCIPSLRPNYEVTTKLTVDTDYIQLTSIVVAVATLQGITDQVSGSTCRVLSNSELSQINSILNVPRVIQ
jgi:hypothetical protein